MAEPVQEQSEPKPQLTGVETHSEIAAHDPANGASDPENLDDYSQLVNSLGDLPVNDDEQEEVADDQDTGDEEEGSEPGPEEEIPADNDSEEEPESEPEDEEEAPAAKTSSRFRVSDPQDKAVLALSKALNVSVIEAAKIIEKGTGKDSEAENAQEDAVPAVTFAEKRREIEEMIEKRAEFDEALDFAESAKLGKEIELAKLDLEEIRQQEAARNSKAEREQSDAWRQTWDNTEKWCAKFYPDSADPKSPLFVRIQEMDEELRTLQDPLYHSPEKLKILAKEAAVQLGIRMRNPSAQAPAAKATAQKRPIVQPAGGNARTTPASAPAKLEERIGKISTEHEYEAIAAELLGDSR